MHASDLELLARDVDALVRLASDDRDHQRWGSWPELVTEFNRLNASATAFGIEGEIPGITPVPRGHQPALGLGFGSNEEIAKFSEIIHKATRLKSVIEVSRPGGRSDEYIDDLCTKFARVARQLARRQRAREPFVISDEYDVQDLVHALLWLCSDDVRTEEWTPSYAGSSARMDFLLKDEKVVLETKFVRTDQSELKRVGDELIVDMKRYRQHPDCSRLVCLVYDPQRTIGNPVGFERDLTTEDTGFTVRVVVAQ